MKRRSLKKGKNKMKISKFTIIILIAGGLILAGHSFAKAVTTPPETEITIIFTSDTVSKIRPVSC